MGFAEYARYDGLGLAGLVQRREVTPGELVEEAIARIERLDPALGAVVHRACDEARRAAAGPLPDGPFRGVPFLVKDLACPVAGMPMTSGSRFTAGEVPREDCEHARRLRAAGVVILGKTNVPEFGITGTTESALLGPCRSPWNPDHIAGGSSGGSASAVAAGVVPLAHASDGLGSIRIPAACCGLVGLKTTRERTPAYRGRELAGGLGVQHVVSRTVRDCAAMLDATDAPESDSPHPPPGKARPWLEEARTPPGGLRIAFSSATPSGRPVHGEVARGLEETAKLLAGLGHEVFERDLELDWRAFYRAQQTFSAAQAAANLRLEILRVGREPREHELEPLTWAGIRRGRSLSGEEVMLAAKALRGFAREILAQFEAFDLLLTPVMGTPPPRIGYLDPVRLDPREVGRRQAECFPFTPPANVTGQPAISLPLAWSDAGLPIGMQLAARYGDEATLFRLAGQLEEARPWRDRRPSIFG